MSKVGRWFVVPALLALGALASGETTPGAMPSPPFPALSAAPLVYALVPNPLGARTWAERQVEALRASSRAELREDLGSVASLFLLALHSGPVVACALETNEGPREGVSVAEARAADAAASARLLGALEALGISPEELVGRPEVPEAALKAAGALDALLDWSHERVNRIRRLLHGEPTLEVERVPRNVRPDIVRYGKPPPLQKPPPVIFSKSLVRSTYKIALGFAIGILIWGFVRRSA